jgi:hypothetical protein
VEVGSYLGEKKYITEFLWGNVLAGGPLEDLEGGSVEICLGEVRMLGGLKGLMIVVQRLNLIIVACNLGVLIPNGDG